MTRPEDIKKLRKAACLTQAELADKCGLATITIRQYESGKRQPRFETMRSIEKVLGIDGTEALAQAVEDIRMLGRMGQNVCPVCAHYNHGEGDEQKCIACAMKWDTDNFEWRGMQEVNHE